MAIIWLIPCALFLGGLGLAAFIWSLRARQYDDPDGDKARIFEAEDYPLPRAPKSPRTGEGETR